MLSRLGGFTPNHSQRAGNQPISLSVYRATFGAALRDSGATETSTSSGAVDQTAQLSGVIPDQESSTNESSAKHLPRKSQASGAVTLEERPPLPATTADDLEDPTEKKAAVNLLVDPAEQENDLDQGSSTKRLPPKRLPREGPSPGTVTLEEREPPFAMPSDHGDTVAEGKTAVNPPNDIIEQQKQGLSLSLRMAPRIDYPKTIDVELPDSFKKDEDHAHECRIDERKRQRFRRIDVVEPLPAGWNPNLLISRECEPLRVHEISIRFGKAPPPLLRLPAELRLQILRYLLRSTTPITNPSSHGSAKQKSHSTLHAHILRACRRLYKEGAPILYQENTFRFTKAIPWVLFKSSQVSIYHDGIRHLELQTTVAEEYCHRTFRVQGQQAVFQEIRTRGHAGWDWPFSSSWRMSGLHTLKLDLKDVHFLPRLPPPTTAHFNPDPRTKDGRDARLSQKDIGDIIYKSCWLLGLRDITIVGIPKLKLLLLLEVGILNDIYNDFGKYILRNREVVRYLSSRSGGWWETQTPRSEAYWHLTNCRPVEGFFWIGLGIARYGPSTSLGVWQLALLMFMNMRAAKHGATDRPVTERPSILWTW